MVLDAVLAYLHFTAIFILFAFLAVQLILIRGPPGLGAKGADFYLNAWPIYVKIGLFVAVGIISVYLTLAFIRWRRALDRAWKLSGEEQTKIRRLVMVEIHIAALIPLFAVIMARGLGR